MALGLGLLSASAVLLASCLRPASAAELALGAYVVAFAEGEQALIGGSLRRAKDEQLVGAIAVLGLAAIDQRILKAGYVS